MNAETQVAYREGRAVVWRDVRDWADENLAIAERILGRATGDLTTGEPTTEAGRRLVAIEPHRRLMVLDIEAEARATATPGLAPCELCGSTDRWLHYRACGRYYGGAALSDR